MLEGIPLDQLEEYKKKNMCHQAKDETNNQFPKSLPAHLRGKNKKK
jgi:hypothetical protein